LPTEAEWERAVTPSRGRYPWGTEEPDRERANFDGNVGAPTPVGIYPAGNGPYGHCDLAGNVWEWCVDDRGGGDKALRGGAWLLPAGDLRAALRNRGVAGLRLGLIGFRVAVVPASS
jgi:formylglycine-generating enzyme required for sulfatase activity